MQSNTHPNFFDRVKPLSTLKPRVNKEISKVKAITPVTNKLSTGIKNLPIPFAERPKISKSLLPLKAFNRVLRLKPINKLKFCPA